MIDTIKNIINLRNRLKSYKAKGIIIDYRILYWRSLLTGNLEFYAIPVAAAKHIICTITVNRDQFAIDTSEAEGAQP